MMGGSSVDATTQNPAGSGGEQRSIVREAMPGILVAIAAAIAAWGGTWWQLREARTQLGLQHEQVLQQLTLQREFSQQLQRQQHDLAVRQLELQDRFARDQIQFQRSLEESWDSRRLAEERRAECASQRTARAEIRRSVYDELSGALVELDEARRMELLYGAVRSVIAEALSVSSERAEYVAPISDLDWTVMKDAGAFFIEAETKTAARARAEARLSSVLLAIVSSYPPSIKSLLGDVEKLRPRSFFIAPEYTAFMEKAASAIRASEKGMLDPEAGRALANDFRVMLQRDVDQDASFSDAVRRLRQAMVGAILSENEGCD
jgi:hypothetical protein